MTTAVHCTGLLHAAAASPGALHTNADLTLLMKPFKALTLPMWNENMASIQCLQWQLDSILETIQACGCNRLFQLGQDNVLAAY